MFIKGFPLYGYLTTLNFLFLHILPPVANLCVSKINHENCHRSTTGKKTAYIPVKETPADQVIVTEKTNILLR